MLDKGILTRKVIKVGMVGDTYTQVALGPHATGQSVVLADYAEAVPSSNTDLTFGGGWAASAAAAASVDWAAAASVAFRAQRRLGGGGAVSSGLGGAG